MQLVYKSDGKASWSVGNRRLNRQTDTWIPQQHTILLQEIGYNLLHYWHHRSTYRNADYERQKCVRQYNKKVVSDRWFTASARKWQT